MVVVRYSVITLKKFIVEFSMKFNCFFINTKEY